MLETTRLLVFGVLCIASRMAIACTPLLIERDNWQQYALGACLALAGIAFAYLYFTNSRMEAPESGGATWWAPYRIIHSLLYTIAATAVLSGNNEWASRALVGDVVVAILVWSVKRI